jgi:hypothetical protein
MRSYVARVSTVALLVILAAWPAGAHSGAAGRGQCTGLAPTQSTQCSNGPHDAFFTYDLGIPDQPVTTHGPLLYADYSGSIESRLEWPAGNPTQAWSVRCNIASGQPVGECTSNGYPPPPMVHFMLTCDSYLTGSPTQHGGSGHWGCVVDHDASSVVLPAVPDRP